ncbi:PIN domain nuclease [Acidithiobacillus sp. IBUN Pt1247-S3]|uniref:type II toxin-antitoxin system VapC family toxin n=1 Tax=Acidithiobacillus sp. IBUN Pt1247-S3 TaxID=3166642 RepID=UPI0034E54825
MILVDSSVWIDFFRGHSTAQSDWLDRNLDVEELAIGDLILAEVLRGLQDDRSFYEVQTMLWQLTQVEIGGFDIAVSAAKNYRKLRNIGVTVRGTVDVLIATRCLHNGLPLLHSDRDFDPFAQHLALRVVDCAA